MFRPLLVAISISFVSMWLAGCGPSGPVKSGDGKTGEHEHAHDHPHEGPHGGHLVELAEPGKENKEEYHAEWLHEESGKITVYVLDGAGKKEVPIAAESVKISVSIGPMKETQEYELPAVDRTTGDKPTAFKFELVSKELLGHLETSGSSSPVVSIDINGTAYAGKIEEHEEHAGHKH